MSISDLFVPNPYPIQFSSGTVGSLTVGSSLTLPTLGPQAPLTIVDSGTQQVFTINYSGAVVQAGVGLLYLNKIGNFVSLFFQQTAGIAAATAAAAITLSTVLPVGYRPPTNITIPCTLATSAAQIVNVGYFSISTAGVMVFYPPALAGAVFPIGPSAGLIAAVSASFPSA